MGGCGPEDGSAVFWRQGWSRKIFDARQKVAPGTGKGTGTEHLLGLRLGLAGDAGDAKTIRDRQTLRVDAPAPNKCEPFGRSAQRSILVRLGSGLENKEPSLEEHLMIDEVEEEEET